MYRFISVFSLLIIITTACRYSGNTPSNAFIPRDSSWKKMSIREKIGQIMIIDSRIYDQQKTEGGLKGFFKKYPIGGFFMADWFFAISKPQDSIGYFIKDAIKQYAGASKYPLFFVEDFERGIGERFPGYTQMPVEMAVGAGGSQQLAYDFEKSIALQAKDLGINWLLHPVADLNMNPFHPLVNERAISDDANFAIPLLKKQVAGLQDQGIIATIKHFPGDGATVRDQHIFTANNPLNMQDWEATYGKVFRALIDDGAASVMVGHITFPAYQKEKHNGVLLPASLSKEVVTDLLKTKMDFKGAVVSDALNMGGVAGYYPSQVETCIAAFKAGIDILMWPEISFMDTLEARILRKEIPMERLDDAVQRVWAMKERFGLLDKKKALFQPLQPAGQQFIDATGKSIAEKAITLVRGDNKLLPLNNSKTKLIMLVVISFDDKTANYKFTKQLLEQRGYKVELNYCLSVFDWNWRMQDLDKYDKFILCLDNKYLDPVGTAYLNGKQAETVWLMNLLPKEKIIAVSYSNPYYMNFYFRNQPVCINAYSSDKFIQEAVVKALTGEISFNGKTPVKLEHDNQQ